MNSSSLLHKYSRIIHLLNTLYKSKPIEITKYTDEFDINCDCNNIICGINKDLELDDFFYREIKFNKYFMDPESSSFIYIRKRNNHWDKICIGINEEDMISILKEAQITNNADWIIKNGSLWSKGIIRYDDNKISFDYDTRIV